jgi:hypothetical protein
MSSDPILVILDIPNEGGFYRCNIPEEGLTSAVIDEFFESFMNNSLTRLQLAAK